ncbi:hypothetical protein FRB96_007403 [Tulasnella sp. 330]|nr:hypothetical protein FRB96_007403 [Tulasnella sp. 330]
MSSNEQEPTYSIQPVPANPPQAGTGLQNDGAFAAFKVTGPLIPQQETFEKLGEPLASRSLVKSAYSIEILILLPSIFRVVKSFTSALLS